MRRYVRKASLQSLLSWYLVHYTQERKISFCTCLFTGLDGPAFPSTAGWTEGGTWASQLGGTVSEKAVCWSWAPGKQNQQSKESGPQRVWQRLVEQVAAGQPFKSMEVQLQFVRGFSESLLNPFPHHLQPSPLLIIYTDLEGTVFSFSLYNKIYRAGLEKSCQRLIFIIFYTNDSTDLMTILARYTLRRMKVAVIFSLVKRMLRGFFKGLIIRLKQILMSCVPLWSLRKEMDLNTAEGISFLWRGISWRSKQNCEVLVTVRFTFLGVVKKLGKSHLLGWFMYAPTWWSLKFLSIPQKKLFYSQNVRNGRIDTLWRRKWGILTKLESGEGQRKI